ncbi:MAG: phosphodiester glycosidase family protein [Actinomycetota bacterium]|nr:phosphodiester glycosidase family protein [Actinomycetota bacterium]
MRTVIKRTSLILAALLVAALVFVGWSIYSAMDQRPGEPFQVVAATWMRDHHMGAVVARMEDFYYQYINKPEVGGRPKISASFGPGEVTPPPSPAASPSPSASIPSTPSPSPTSSSPASALPTTPPDFNFSPGPRPTTDPGAVTHLSPPVDLISPVAVPEPLEGVWQGVGSKVDGQHAVYVTRVRTDNVHTSYYATAMWLDTSLLNSMFVPGYEEPKGGANPFNGALPQELWPLVMANTNGAFRLEDTRAGYWYDGQMVHPLEKGRASAVFYRDGQVFIGRWGRNLSLTPDMIAVRQNLDLIVDHGQSKVNGPEYNVNWGATTDKENLAWRAGMGQRADGSLVYVVGQALSAQSLADTLVATGVQRAMVLDMNEYWSAGFFFNHQRDGDPICHKLDPDTSGPCDRFLHSFARDSFQFLAAYPLTKRHPAS